MKLELENIVIGFAPDEPFDDFIVDKYHFRYTGPRSQSAVTIYSNDRSQKEARRNHQNAILEYEGEVPSSILFTRDGIIGKRGMGPNDSNDRNFLEDLMVIGSIINGWNWQLKLFESYNDYWPFGKNNLKDICEFSSVTCAKYIQQSIEKIHDPKWQLQFENGFQLIMLKNHARIHTLEACFLSNFIIWEWLFPHLKNPNGASFKDESSNLREIIAGVLSYYWPEKVNKKVFNSKDHNIFDVLRNQIAHSGRIPIDRSYASDWMTKLSWENEIDKYLRFFNALTQVVVLKTLDISSEQNIFRFHHPCSLEYFLQNGRFPEITPE